MHSKIPSNFNEVQGQVRGKSPVKNQKVMNKKGA